MKRSTVFFLISLMLSGGLSAQIVWDLDKNHSSITFAAEHVVLVNEATDAEADYYNVGKTEGRFSEFEIDFEQPGDDLGDSRIEALIDVASLSTENMVRDRHLQSSDFFNVANFPSASFVSEEIRNVEGQKYEMTGGLTIKGVTKPVTFEMNLNAQTENNLGEDYLSLTATTVIDRHDFDLAWSQLIEAGAFRISNYVTITIQANLRRK